MGPMYDRFEEWMIRQGLSANTARQYRRRITFAVEKEFFDPEDHDAREVEDFVAAQGGSPSNHDSWAGALHWYQKYLADFGRVHSFADRVRFTRRPKRLPKPVALTDIRRVLSAIPDTPEGHRDSAMIHLLYCGLRNNEVCESELRSYRRRSVTVIGKNDKERVVPINDVAWRHVMRYAVERHGLAAGEEELEDVFEGVREAAKPHERMFFTAGGSPMYPRALWGVVHDAAKKAGITDRIHPHMFRHSFATHVLDRGLGNLIALKDVLGHESLETTKLYVETSQTGRNQVNAFHPFEQGVNERIEVA